MGMFGGEKKKKVPNSRKKKGGLVKGVAPVPEQAKPLATAKVTPSKPVATAPKPTPVSVSDRAKAFQPGAAANKPTTAASETIDIPTSKGKPSVSERAKAFGIATNGNIITNKPPNTKLSKPSAATTTSKKEEEEASSKGKKFSLFGGSKAKADTPVVEDATPASPVAPKKKLGLFGKGKSKDTPTLPPEPPKETKVEETNDSETKKKFSLFGGNGGKSKDADDKENNSVVVAVPVSSSGKKTGKLSMAALSIKIPGLGGGSKGTDLSKSAPGKPPPQIDIYADSEINPDHQGHAGMSDKAKSTLVAPKGATLGKNDWKFLYELAQQYDAYKAQEAQAMKNSPKGKPSMMAAASSSSPGDIKNNLKNVLGGGAAGAINYNANGSFLTNKFLDQYLVDRSSGMSFDFSGETSLYKRFNRKDQEQRTVSEKFAQALRNHPKSKKITRLNLSGSVLPDAFLVALCDQCVAKGGLPNLQVLNLESNDLTREGIEALSKCIASSKIMLRLQILKLENQKKEISAGAEEVLGDAIVQSPSLVQVGLVIKGGVPKQQVSNTIQANLDKLRLARREHASKKGKLKARKRNEMETLFDTIAANKDKNLTEVDLTGNLRFLGLDAVERTKTGAAFANNKYVTKVTMTKLKLDDDFAEAFGKSLAKNKTLETVILDSNSFSAKGIKALLTGLGRNKAVTNFQVRHQSKTMASADEESLLALLQINTTLVNLGTDVRNPLVQSQLGRKMNENRETQRKQRNAQNKK